jgi:hypothetical protein
MLATLHGPLKKCAIQAKFGSVRSFGLFENRNSVFTISHALHWTGQLVSPRFNMPLELGLFLGARDSVIDASAKRSRMFSSARSTLT